MSRSVPLQNLHRLHTALIQRADLIFALFEVYPLELHATDIRIPGSPIVEFHPLLVYRHSKLGGTWKPFRGNTFRMLRADGYVELIEEMKAHLPEGIKSVFISSVAGLNIAKLKDMLWAALHE